MFLLSMHFSHGISFLSFTLVYVCVCVCSLYINQCIVWVKFLLFALLKSLKLMIQISQDTTEIST